MDFLGSTTPVDLLASVTSGVQDTGESLWPLFTFVGIGVAFVIAGYVVSFIRKSIGGRK
jgi:LPXTG-motif cell wall-anchored protein